MQSNFLIFYAISGCLARLAGKKMAPWIKQLLAAGLVPYAATSGAYLGYLGPSLFGGGKLSAS